MSEDCLKISIFSPKPKPINAPVVFYIHGGAFVAGTALMFSDPHVFTSQGFIVAYVNYRLGVFGFLNLGLENVTGNAALLDQQMALQWVKDNIQQFGGNPDNITLLGCSAGSASVGFQMLSPGSRGLFRRVIMMSGAPTSAWAIRETEDLNKLSIALLRTMGCSDVNITLGVKCLRDKHVNDILEARLPTTEYFHEQFVGSVDGQFLVEHPDVTVAAKRITKADVLIGSAFDDGAFIITADNRNLFNTTDGRVGRQDFVRLIGTSPKFEKPRSDEQKKLLDLVYTNWSNPDDPYLLRDAITAFATDTVFSCKINHFADALSRSGNNVYKYVFDHKTALDRGASWMRAGHCSDSELLLYPKLTIGPEQDNRVRNEMLTSFINFIKTGNPNKPEGRYFPWPKYTSKRLYKKFSYASTIENSYRAQECAALLELVPELDSDKLC